MPAKDIFHASVKNALIKDQWIITDDPLSIRIEAMQMYPEAEEIIQWIP